MYPKPPYPKISVVICTLNEAKNLPYVLPYIPEWVDEVVLVDGHSTDGTVEVAKKLRPDVKVFYQAEKGKGEALRYGIKSSTGDIIVTLDADGETDPRDMHRFIEALLRGCEFAKGSRLRLSLPAGKPTHRIIGNLIIAVVFNMLYLTRFTDLCSGYNAFWKKSFERVSLDSEDSFEDEPLLVSRAKKMGLKIVEVGHHDRGRISGESKAPSWRQGLKAIKTIFRERLYLRGVF
jgi:glycosyltransferase involved in cell wall biosynthesis